jgi:hypothetical protein
MHVMIASLALPATAATALSAKTAVNSDSFALACALSFVALPTCAPGDFAVTRAGDVLLAAPTLCFGNPVQAAAAAATGFSAAGFSSCVRNALFLRAELLAQPLAPVVAARLVALSPTAVLLRFLADMEDCNEELRGLRSRHRVADPAAAAALASFWVGPGWFDRAYSVLATLQRALQTDPTQSLAALLAGLYPVASRLYTSCGGTPDPWSFALSFSHVSTSAALPGPAMGEVGVGDTVPRVVGSTESVCVVTRALRLSRRQALAEVLQALCRETDAAPHTLADISPELVNQRGRNIDFDSWLIHARQHHPGDSGTSVSFQRLAQ